MIKILLTSLFSIAMLTSSAHSQGKILISSRDSSKQTFRWSGMGILQNALSLHYHGLVEVRFGAFPDSLEQYDAIFTDMRFYETDPRSFTYGELEKLSNYLDKVGKLYIEINNNSLGIWYMYDYPAFYERIGYLGNVPGDIAPQGISEINGVQGFFTEGLHITRTADSADVRSQVGVIGDVSTVLVANTTPPVNLAMQHDKENRKVVYHWPLVLEHYNEFLGRVICNYFGLCEPLAVSRSNQSETELSVAYDPVSNKLIVENAGRFSTLALYNTLGVKVFESNIFERMVELPNELPAGNYFVVAAGAGRISTKGIIVWR